MDCFIINLGRFKDDDYTIGAFSIMNSLREEGLNVQYFSNLKDSLPLKKEDFYHQEVFNQASKAHDQLSSELLSSINSNTKFVGFSVLDDNFYASLYYARAIKSRFQNIVIGFGGPFFTNPDTLNYDYSRIDWLDFFTTGEAQETIKTIAKYKFDLASVPEIQGLSYYREGAWVIRNHPRPFDHFKPTSYTTNFDNQEEIHTSFSIGCPYRCSFCTQHFHYPEYKLVPVEDCIEILKPHAGKKLNFSDALINSRTTWLKNLCQQIIDNDLNIFWQSWFRFGDHMNDLKLLNLLYESGCRSIRFGLESASSPVLKHMRKFHNEKIIYETFNKIRELYTHGKIMLVKLNILVGYPNESEEDFQKTLKFIYFNCDLINHVSVNSVIIQPKLDKFSAMIESGELTYSSGHDWSTKESTPEVRKSRLLKIEELLNKCKIQHDIMGNDGLDKVITQK